MAWTALKSGGGKEYELEQLGSTYTSNFSSISVANTVVKIGKFCRSLLFLKSYTNQMVTLKQRCLVAKFSRASSIAEIIMPDRQKISDGNLEQENVLEEFKLEVDRLLKRNRDLFVSEDKT